MNVSSGMIAIVALAAGAVASVGTVALTQSDQPAGISEGAPTAQAVDALRREVTRLSESQDAMQRQVQTLELQLTASGGDASSDGVEPLAASHQELAALRDQVATLTAQVGGDSGDPVIIDTVSAALDQIREQEEADRKAERETAQADRRAERLEELTKELGLDTYQAGRLGEEMLAYDTRRDEIMDAARASGDFGGLRDAFSAMYSEVGESLGNYLTPSQLESLDAMGGPRALSGGMRWGGGGFGGGGGRGGRGGGSEN